MDAAVLLRAARIESGLTLRALAERAGTSHATLAAYEAGRVEPKVSTLVRIVRAAGFATDALLERRVDGTRAAREAKGRELAAALELASMFPARHAAAIERPPFPRDR